MAKVCIYEGEPDWNLIADAWYAFEENRTDFSLPRINQSFEHKYKLVGTSTSIGNGWSSVIFETEEAYLLFKLEWS